MTLLDTYKQEVYELSGLVSSLKEELEGANRALEDLDVAVLLPHFPQDMQTIKDVADTLHDVAEYLAKSHCAVCRRAATDIVSNATSRLWPITHRRENALHEPRRGSGVVLDGVVGGSDTEGK